MEALPDSTYGRCLRFILGTGLRASEATGLRWQDILEKCFSVNQLITEYRDYESDDGPKVKKDSSSPKTSAGNRTIPLTMNMQNLLHEQQMAQTKNKEQILAKGISWQSSGLVFCGPQGQPLDRHNLARTLRTSLDKASLPHRGIHALRHTFATNAVQSGMDFRTLTEIIGHSKIAFTLQTYAHSDLETKRKALETMEADLA